MSNTVLMMKIFPIYIVLFSLFSSPHIHLQYIYEHAQHTQTDVDTHSCAQTHISAAHISVLWCLVSKREASSGEVQTTWPFSSAERWRCWDLCEVICSTGGGCSSPLIRDQFVRPLNPEFSIAVLDSQKIMTSLQSK